MKREFIFQNGKTLPVGTMYCIGRNYSMHAQEMGGQADESPVVFIKPPASYVKDGGIVKLPEISNNIHYETELVIIIGNKCENSKIEDALYYIGGYAVGLDLTLRDLQLQAKKEGNPWAISKGFRGSAPISNVVPENQFRYEIPNFELELKLNGNIVQKGNTSEMVHPIDKLITYLSGIFILEPGDCIFTGTPEGVGKIQSGDKLHAELKGFVSLDITAE